MTISSQIREAGPFTGNGTTTVFPFAFKVLQASDLYVVRLVTATGVQSTLVSGTDYNVAVNTDQNASPGGTVTLVTALPTGNTLTLTSAVPYLQPTLLTNAGGFYPTVINDALDRLTILTQQLSSGVSRTLRFPLSDPSAINNQLPVASARAGNTLAFDSAGNAIAGPAVGAISSAATSASAAATSAAQAAASQTATAVSAAAASASQSAAATSETQAAIAAASATAITGSLTWQAVQTASFTAIVNCGYPVNTTSSALTALLPASPQAGNYIEFVDYARKFSTNNLTINPNGKNLQGSSANVLLKTDGGYVSLVYVDAVQGWLVFNGAVQPLAPSAYSVAYLLVAGGGGGGAFGGGGGAGGFKTSTTVLTAGVTYSFTIGAGGAPAANGNSTVFASIDTALGGGAGGSNSNAGSAGGSGGGGGTSVSLAAGGSGTAGQGYAGGSGFNGSVANGGGGGGAGGVGTSVTAPSAAPVGAGGPGASSSITGTPVTYAGGGGGGGYGAGAAATGGSGGGGAGSSTTVGSNGTANTGGGGGGGGYSGGALAGGSGGSGVAIISIPTASYTGIATGSPVVTVSGSNTILKFTQSGTYTA